MFRQLSFQEIARLTICLLPLCLFFPHAHAQSPTDLDRLIFEPALLNRETGEEISRYTYPVQFLSMNLTPIDNNIQVENPLSILEISSNINEYLEDVADLETSDGPYTGDLFQTLMNLGIQYQMLGDHEQAIETFQRAEHISRINSGLYHPDQYASTEKMIQSYLAMGDIRNANLKQRYMLYINQQHFGITTPETLPTLVNLAQSNMENFQHMLNAPVVPTFTVTGGFSFGGSGGPRRQPTQKELAFGSLFQAQQNFYRAIGTMLENKMYFDPLLLDLEYGLLETLMLQAYRNSILEDSDFYMSEHRLVTGSHLRRNNSRFTFSYAEGKNAFERILIYTRNNPEAKIYQVVNALMEYGDWDTLFDRGMSASTKYREAYDLILSFGVGEESIRHLFRPPLPVHLPLLTAKPNSREKFGITPETKLEHDGYIDIAFTISRYGRARNFETLGMSEGTSGQIEKRLRRYLRNSPFRPRLMDDGKFGADRVQLRYYYSWAPEII